MNLLKTTSLYLILSLLMIGCSDNTNSNELLQEETSNAENSIKNGTILLTVTIKSALSEEELIRIAKERKPQFEAINGLIQKHYIKTKTPGEYRGVYIWDSMESLKKYKESDLAATIAKAYKLTEPPTFEVVDLMFSLRD